MNTRLPMSGPAVVPTARNLNSALARAIAALLSAATPFCLLGAGAEATPEAAPGAARLIKSIPVPPKSEHVLPPPPEVPPTVTRKRFDTKLSPAELTALKRPTTAFPAEPPPLGLPRLAGEIQKARFDQDALEIRAGDTGARGRKAQGISYVDLEQGRSWKRPLRKSSERVLFVSVLMNAGIATTVNVGGALLRISDSEKPGFAEMETGAGNPDEAIEWKRLGYQVPVDAFEGRQLAQLPLLTVRIDRTDDTWDVFSGYLRVATGLPLATGKKSVERQISVEAGTQGAWICGIVSSDENPLFVDANSDGIDDGLEWMVEEAAQQKKEEILKEPKPAPVQWTPVLHVGRPLPDRMTKVSATDNVQVSEDHP